MTWITNLFLNCFIWSTKRRHFSHIWWVLLQIISNFNNEIKYLWCILTIEVLKKIRLTGNIWAYFLLKISYSDSIEKHKTAGLVRSWVYWPDTKITSPRHVVQWIFWALIMCSFTLMFFVTDVFCSFKDFLYVHVFIFYPMLLLAVCPCWLRTIAYKKIIK